MAEGKKSFVAYCDWITTFNELSDEEAGVLIKHLLRYVNDQNPEPPDKLTQIAFAPIKATLKRDLEKYERKRTKNSENAKVRWNANASERIQTDAKHADSDSVSVSDSGSVSVEEGKPSSPQKGPTFEEWQEYFEAEGKDPNHDHCRASWLYYEEKGWRDRDGKEVKNWKLKVRNTNWWKDCPKAQMDIYSEFCKANPPSDWLELLMSRGWQKKEAIEAWRNELGHRKEYYYPNKTPIV